MSKIETILTRMMNEPAFADAVFANAETALSEYDLSADVVLKIANMVRSDFNAIVTDERKSFLLADVTEIPMAHDYLVW